jgi:hypothetical protein
MKSENVRGVGKSKGEASLNLNDAIDMALIS